MSVVAWDGRLVAADKQGTTAGLRITLTKMRRLPSGEVLAWTGNQDFGLTVAQWYEDGADMMQWPACQNDKDDWARLIVIANKRAKVFERQPFPIVIEDEFMAWGSGRDYAMGAMARGANAQEAVKIAMRFDQSCGMGCDVVEL